VASAEQVEVVVRKSLALSQVLDLVGGDHVPELVVQVLQDRALAQRTGTLEGVDRLVHLKHSKAASLIEQQKRCYERKQ